MQRDKIARSPLNRQSRTTTPPTNHGGARYRADLPIQRSLTIVNPFRNAIIPRRGNFSWRAVDNFRESSLKKKKKKKGRTRHQLSNDEPNCLAFLIAPRSTNFFFFFFFDLKDFVIMFFERIFLRANEI